MQILLVEDNPVDQMFVARSLRQVEGFNCRMVFCDTLADALRRIETSQFDVVLLDLWLPDSEGVDTCRRFLGAARNTPVVVMTATDDRALASDAMRLGAQDYLVKGAFPGSAVVRVLQYAIDRFQFHRELAFRENHFKQVMSHVPAMIWTTDCALRITSATGAELQLLGLDPQCIVGKTLEVLFERMGEADDAFEAHQNAIRGESVAFETKWLGRVFEVRLDPLRETEKGVVGMVGIALDVTERRYLGYEIDFARSVQESLLPATHPVVDGFDIFGGSYPARQTCGDWFDYLKFADGSLGLTVGDVSSKGYGPAILGSTIGAYLEVLAENHSDIQEILCRCNRLVCRRRLEGQFAVLSLARLRPGVRSVTYGGAGDGMLVISSQGRLKSQVSPSGFPLGLDDDTSYDSPAQVAVEPGDVLVLLTDGFRETFGPNDELFGESRIVETVAANLHASASEIFEVLRRTAREFADGGNQHDDMTGIVVKVL